MNPRIDAFDGAVLRGVVTGVFADPQSGTSGEAAIAGEVAFSLPVTVQ